MCRMGVSYSEGINILESSAEFLEKSKISFMISKICRFRWWMVTELSFTSKNLILGLDKLYKASSHGSD